jgi:hypothetical protein
MGTESTLMLIFWFAIGVIVLIAVAALLRGFVQWLIGIDDLGRLLHNNNNLLRRQNELLAKLAGEPVEPSEQAEPQPR